ncbi:MAG: CDP-glycerol glycerophosphotransferase [Bacteroidetes bacterium]|nr:MAG: CDP-glycerol glycerophosphotransferase [Bacteroidota bacterium]
MRILLFCEQKYALNILHPLALEAQEQGDYDILWYLDGRHIEQFPYANDFKHTTSMQEAADFMPEAIFAPGNIVPYYLSGVKINVFHGYAAEKGDQFQIRGYFDIYATQGPYFTQEFERLKGNRQDFHVVETGWLRQDSLVRSMPLYNTKAKEIREKYQAKHIILYAPTFSPRLTSIPQIKLQLIVLAQQEENLILIKFHPMTHKKWVNEYRELAKQFENILYIEDNDIAPYEVAADIMLSDTSSVVYEMLLLNKPVITVRTIAHDLFWQDVTKPEELPAAVWDNLKNDPFAAQRQWVVDNYDPHLDGLCTARTLQAAKDFIQQYGVPKIRHTTIWRRYMSVHTFGRVQKKNI